MGKFKICPSCFTDKKGHSVWRCSKCKTLYCVNNKKYTVLGLGDCPNCGSGLYGTAGEVDPNA